MMTRNDAVAMQQLCAMMTFSDALPVLLMDTVTTRAWEFSKTLNQNIEGLARETMLNLRTKFENAGPLLR